MSVLMVDKDTKPEDLPGKTHELLPHARIVRCLFLVGPGEYWVTLPVWALPAKGDTVLSKQFMDFADTSDLVFNVKYREWDWDEGTVCYWMEYAGGCKFNPANTLPLPEGRITRVLKSVYTGKQSVHGLVNKSFADGDLSAGELARDIQEHRETFLKLRNFGEKSLRTVERILEHEGLIET